MNRARAYSAFLCITVLAIAAVAACSLAAAAPSSNPASGTIRIALPESDVAVYMDASGMAAFTGTDIQRIGRTGEPSLPCQSVRVLLPPGTDLRTVKPTITGYKWTGIDGEWDIPPVGPLVVGGVDGTCAVSPAGEAVVNVRDPAIYESDALFPAEPIVKVDTQVLRGWKMAQVFYAPYAYNPVERQVFRLSGSAIEVTFERTSLKSSSASADFSGADKVRGMTVNFAEMSGEYSGYAVSAETGRYVIITTSAIQTASANLMDFVASKEARGFTVQVVTEGAWGGGTGDAAAENLRSWLQDNYLDLNIRYVLLIGNPNPATGDVPMKLCYSYHTAGIPPVTTTYDVPTDFYYAELTSDWDNDGDGKYGEYDDDFLDFSEPLPRAAEVAVGRIPYYGTMADLDHILSKIIAYETLPDEDLSWRRHVLLPMKPSNTDPPATLGYQLGEEIKDDILVPSGWTYHRVYEENYDLDPDPETTPCTYTNVKNAWNGSDFGAVFWWTHGSETSAADVMNLANAATLDDEHPGFTFQSSCLNGRPEVNNNLGYSLLKNGCIATVSASRVSWYEKGQTSFAGTSTNSGMTFEYAKRLIADGMYAGDALIGLRADVSLNHEVLWMNYLGFNLYGCPAVGLFTPPVTETSDATSINTSSAHLNGNLTSLGTADSVSVSFVWGTTEGGPYPNGTTQQAKTVTGAFYFDLGSLTPGTTYYYKARAAGWGTAYGDEKSFTTPTEPPSVSTDSADDVTATLARLNGDLASLGTAANVTVSFEWGTADGGPYPNTVAVATPMTETGAFSALLSGLAPKTTYYYVAKAIGDGSDAGYQVSFTTLPIPPAVTTNDADNLDNTLARLNGILTHMGTATSVVVSFEWGTTAGGPYPNMTGNQTRNGTGIFSANLSSLTPGTTYYCRAKAVGDGTAYGEEESFITSTEPPAVVTDNASNIAIDGARLNGHLSSLGTAAGVSVSFQWGTAPGIYGNETSAEVKNSTGDFYFDLSGLASDTTFYYRARAVGHGDPVDGLEKSFTTGIPPAVTTLEASALTYTLATLNGDLTSLGAADNVTVSFVWGTNPGCSNETPPVPANEPGPFSANLTDLDPGTTYYYRAKAHGGAGPVYGDLMSFTTLSTPPVVTTSDATSLAIHSATLNGNLVELGTAVSVRVSFVWGTTSGVYSNETAPVSADAPGSFSSSLGGLAPGTNFYYRAKAVGQGEPQFGGEMIFTTLPAPPAVSTSAVSNLTAGSARLNGDLTLLGSAATVTVSLQWGMASGDYIHETTPDVKTAIGAFYSDIAGLDPGSTYYYRAKVVVDGVAVYGGERSFSTPLPPQVAGAVPGSGSIGQSLTVTITGTNFTGVTAVSFGPDVVVGSFSAVSATQINTAIRILCDGAPGIRNVSVTTPGGTATLPGGFSVSDSSPNQPGNTSPADKAGIMTLTPTLVSSAFSHTCPSRTHAASQWQVTAVSGDYSKPVFDSAADTVNLTSITLPRGVLGEPEWYWWRVRYRDSSGIWSDWSKGTRFARPDFLRAALAGSAEIHVTDPMSRVTGVVGAQPQQGIPYSDYFSGIVTIISPGDSYGYAVVGTEDGAYTLTVVRVIGDQSLTFRAAGIPLSAGEIHHYVIDWETLSKGGKSVTIRIDSDGDGAFDKTAFLDGEISTKEFKAAVYGYRAPVWVWILFGLSLVAASLGLYALSRAARHRDQTEVAQ